MRTQRVYEDPWEWKPEGPPCPAKHAWVKFISHGFRECIDCGEKEKLWADFGIVKILPAA